MTSHIRQPLTWLGIAAALLLATAAPLSAKPEYNVIGAYAGPTTQTFFLRSDPPTLIIDLSVAGFANELGQFTAVGEQTVNLLTGTYTGSYTFTTANGDTLTATTSGIRYPCLSSGVYCLEENFTITGGTGEFSEATGSGTGRGVFSSLTNQIALVFAATVSTTSTSGSIQRE